MQTKFFMRDNLKKAEHILFSEDKKVNLTLFLSH